MYRETFPQYYAQAAKITCITIRLLLIQRYAQRCMWDVNTAVTVYSFNNSYSGQLGSSTDIACNVSGSIGPPQVYRRYLQQRRTCFCNHTEARIRENFQYTDIILKVAIVRFVNSLILCFIYKEGHSCHRLQVKTEKHECGSLQNNDI